MSERQTALITGASAGFGRALAAALVADRWRVIITARGRSRLDGVRAELGARFVTAICGDVTDAGHRAAIVAAVTKAGHLDLVVNNASALGPSPMPHLDRYPPEELTRVLDTNVVAPVAVTAAVLPFLSAGAAVVNISSDAAATPYAGWGGYGASKAALDQATAVLAVEHPELRVYAFDPGDMRTAMHQAAFPGEDISDRPEPETVVPALLRLLAERPPSGRYAASAFLSRGTAS